MTRAIAMAEFAELCGQELGVSRWFSIDQTRIDDFADATEDHQWIHVDVSRAGIEAGGTIAHGFLSLSMLSAMTYDIWTVPDAGRSLNYGFNKLRFTEAVPAGARIRLRELLVSVETKAGGLLLTRDCTVEIEDRPRPALVAQWLGLILPPALSDKKN